MDFITIIVITAIVLIAWTIRPERLDAKPAAAVLLNLADIRDLSHTDTEKAECAADELLVNQAAVSMREKLAQARGKGRGGWWDPQRCSTDALRQLLVEHVDKGDMRDVMNLAAMIHVRESAAFPTAVASASISTEASTTTG